MNLRGIPMSIMMNHNQSHGTSFFSARVQLWFEIKYIVPSPIVPCRPTGLFQLAGRAAGRSPLYISATHVLFPGPKPKADRRNVRKSWLVLRYSLLVRVVVTPMTTSCCLSTWQQAAPLDPPKGVILRVGWCSFQVNPLLGGNPLLEKSMYSPVI